jgi:hypothetical protein
LYDIDLKAKQMEGETTSSLVDDDRVWDIGINTDGLMDGVTGRVGNFVFRTLNGVTVVSCRPKKPRTESAGQRDNRERFRLASAFAKQELLDPDKLKYYERLLKKRPWLRNAYTVAIKTYMNKQDTVVNRARKEEERKTRRLKLIRRKVMLKRAQSGNVSFP